MTPLAHPGRRPILLGLALALLATLVPVQPVVAEEIAPETKSATIDGVEDLLDDAVDGRTPVIEAPIPFVGMGVRGRGPAPELLVRTLDLEGAWSPWTEVELLDEFDAPDPGTPEAGGALDLAEGSGTWSTDAIWTGPSSHAQLQVTGADPNDLEVAFTDTAGLSETWTQRLARAVRARTTAAPAEASTDHGGPHIRPRTDWLAGGRETRSGTPSQATVRFAVLHHTATTNDYSPEQSAQQIRNMHHWHTANNGWADLGYNFVVDRFGTIWEGRYGGVDKGIVGAHAGGWNTGSFGVAIMGNMNTAMPDARALDSAVSLIAWKYAVHGVDPDPDARVWINGHHIRRLEGHRNVRSTYTEWSSSDSFAQDCPGRNLSWRLPTMRDAIAGAYPAAAARLPGPFVDVPRTHAFHDAIAWMRTTKLSSGYADGTYRPAEDVSRQAMVAFLHRLAGQPTGAWEPTFSDVTASHAFYDAISWAAAEGITGGYADGTFRPEDVVSRQAAAAFLYRAAGEPGGSWSSGFSDVPADHPFHRAISWMASNGISGGYADGTFGAERAVTRQAVAHFLHEASKLR